MCVTYVPHWHFNNMYPITNYPGTPPAVLVVTENRYFSREVGTLPAVPCWWLVGYYCKEFPQTEANTRLDSRKLLNMKAIWLADNAVMLKKNSMWSTFNWCPTAHLFSRSASQQYFVLVYYDLIPILLMSRSQKFLNDFTLKWHLHSFTITNPFIFGAGAHHQHASPWDRWSDSHSSDSPGDDHPADEYDGQKEKYWNPNPLVQPQILQ